MTDTPSRLIMQGLSELDAEELVEALGHDVELVRPEVPEGTLAEPATIAAVVYLTPIAIAAVALYFSKSRRFYLLKESHRIEYPDGRIEVRTFEIRASSEGEAKAEMARQLGQWAEPAQAGLPS